mgnify:CR=1 FL=1
MSIKEDLIKTRDEYISLIKKELLGPGSEISIPDENHELISDSPNTRYSMGILFTKENKMNATMTMHRVSKILKRIWKIYQK